MKTKHNEKEFKSGLYETYYGNACEWEEGSDTAYDVDMAQEIPVEFVEFTKPIDVER